MIINEGTKISDLIKFNPDSIDTIAELNKHFRKLRNPILRRTLAKRVTIRDAAKIGGVSVSAFLESLEKIGFTIDENEMKDTSSNSDIEMSINENTIIVDLDVRPNIAAGNDPFKIIMHAIKDLPDGSTLRIINVFEPIPLINILREKGYNTRVERPDQGVVYTYFKKANKDVDTPNFDVTTTKPGDFDSTLERYEGRYKTIDVRGMEMPEPMVTILTELEGLPLNHALFVHHKKFPKFLIPELENRGFGFVKHAIDDHNIDFLFFRK